VTIKHSRPFGYRTETVNGGGVVFTRFLDNVGLGPTKRLNIQKIIRKYGNVSFGALHDPFDCLVILQFVGDVLFLKD
jgi:hypothetical protein